MKKYLLAISSISALFLSMGCRTNNTETYNDNGYSYEENTISPGDVQDFKGYDDNGYRETDIQSNNSSVAPPDHPTISLEEAIKIAQDHLDSQGLSQATFRADGIDYERGRWVWELDFRDGNTEIEFYIDVETGEIVKFEVDHD